MTLRPMNVVTLPVVSPISGDMRGEAFFITAEAELPLLGRCASEAMGLIKRVNYVLPSGPRLTETGLRREFQQNFKGRGELPEPYDMQLDESVKPVIQSVHLVPITQHSKLQKALTKLEAEGVIDDADGPSEWVSYLVVSQKRNGQLRLCLDPKPLNHAIKREPYLIPTAEEVFQSTAGWQENFHSDWYEGGLLACETHWAVKSVMYVPYTEGTQTFQAYAVWYYVSGRGATETTAGLFNITAAVNLIGSVSRVALLFTPSNGLSPSVASANAQVTAQVRLGQLSCSQGCEDIWTDRCI